MTTTPIPARPFDRSFWVAPGRLLAGLYPGDVDPAQEEKKLRALLAAGIRAFVDLTHEDDRNHHDQALAPYTPALETIAREQDVTWAYQRCQIVDETAPTKALMREILDAIDGHIAAGRPVYVHCWGGRGRTGTAAGCWIARHRIAEGPEVLAAMQRMRRREGALDLPCPAEKSQRDFVVQWKPGA